MKTAIKAGDGYKVSVLAAPFGSPQDRDSDGEWFSHRTKFHLDKYTPQPIYYHGYTKDKKQSDEPVYIGSTVGSSTDHDGVWLDVQLDPTTPEAIEVWEAAKASNAAASSGSIAHLVRKTKGGEILQWPMAEISLWALSPDRPQANKRALAIPALKAAGIDIPDELVRICESEDQRTEGHGHGPISDGDGSSNIFTFEVEGTTMNEEQIAALVAKSVKAAIDDAEAARKAVEDATEAQQQKITSAVEQALKAQAEELNAANEAALKKLEDEAEAARKEAAEARRLPFGEAAYQSKFANLARYDNVSPDDLAFAHAVVSAAAMKGGQRPSEDLTKAIAIGFAESTDSNHNAAKSAMKMAGLAMKANELNQSTLASYGDEWVHTAYSSQVWEKVRLMTPIVARIPSREVPQGVESITIPIESTAPTFYKVAQASAQDANPGRITPTFTSSRMGTANSVLNVSKLGAMKAWSQELTEDSIVDWAAELRRILMLEYAEVLEGIVIDGDTATGATTNINDIAGTPAGNEPFMLFDGFRKLALLGASGANARDGGALAVADYLSTVRMLGPAGVNGWQKNNVAFITDVNTGYATLNLAELQTRDSIAAPTIESGMVTRLFGYDVIASANMHRSSADRLTNAAGKIDVDVTANNTKGGILAVRWDQWTFGFKRRMTIEVDRDIYSDANAIVMHSRVGLINRDAEAAAISYNLTV